MLASHLACLHLRATGSLSSSRTLCADPITLGHRQEWPASATLQFQVPPKVCYLLWDLLGSILPRCSHAPPHVLPECHHMYNCPTYQHRHPVSQRSVIEEDKLVDV